MNSFLSKSPSKILVGTVGLVLLAVAFTLVSDGPLYVATFKPAPLPPLRPQVPVEISIGVSQSSAFLPEYHRKLVVKSGAVSIERAMDEDTGGYSDANLSMTPEGDYYVEGPFDSYRISLEPLAIEKANDKVRPSLQYLGTYTFAPTAKDGDRGAWAFLDSRVMPYRDLEALPRN